MKAVNTSSESSKSAELSWERHQGRKQVSEGSVAHIVAPPFDGVVDSVEDNMADAL